MFNATLRYWGINMQTFEYEYTDTFAGEANYCWVKRGKVHVPDLVHYGYTGSTDGSYSKADKAQRVQILRKAKADLGISEVKGDTSDYGDMIRHDLRAIPTVLFIWYDGDQ